MIARSWWSRTLALTAAVVAIAVLPATATAVAESRTSDGFDVIVMNDQDNTWVSPHNGTSDGLNT